MPRLLAADLLLLAWDDDKGTAPMSRQQALPAGVAGALVLEAVLAELVTIEDERVQVTGRTASDELLTQVVAEVERSRRAPKATKLVQRLGKSRHVTAVRSRLVAEGILREERRRLLGIFPYTRHPTADAAATGRLRDDVRELLLGRRAAEDADDRLVMLAALSGATGILDGLVERSERKEARERAEAFGEGDGLTAAVGEVVRSAQAAAIAAVGAATAASAASSASN